MTRLLGGPDTRSPLPNVDARFIDAIERAGVVGRGGAGFPTATKWRAVAQRSDGGAVIVVNGAEGEPHSQKDRALMTFRPHLVLDGAFVAARVLRARRIVLYIGERHVAARDAMLAALAQRTEQERWIVSTANAPARYVAGAETAAIHYINDGVATPTTVPPYPFEHGVDRAPTLVQNVETLAHIAMLAKTGHAPSTVLVTAVGGVAHPGVLEAERHATIGEILERAGGFSEPPRALLIGGYFGSWSELTTTQAVRLDNASLHLGCGVLGVLPQRSCPVCETAGVLRYLAEESSAQCGPCFFGLRALAEACTRIAHEGTNPQDIGRLQRWAAEVRGRGACRHPDGAATFLSSSLAVFADDFAGHRDHRARSARRAA